MAAAIETLATRLKKFTYKKTAKKSCFPACLGFSGELKRKKRVGEKRPNRKDNGSDKKISWFLFFKPRKKKSGRKTVPVDVSHVTVPYEHSPCEEIKEVSEEPPEIQAIPENSQIPGTPAVNPAKTHVSVLSGSVSGACESADQGVSLKTRKGIFSNCPSQPPESLTPSNEMGQKLTGRKTPRNKSCSQPSSPETKTTRAMMRSYPSLPLPDRRKTSHPLGNSRLGDRNSDRQTRTIDPMAGLSILVITLVIMLLWGRLCAIICTAAWFYFIPRLRTMINSGEDLHNNSSKPDIDSNEYKKKVIMDGLLERTHRNSTGNI